MELESQSTISGVDKDYEHTQNVFKELKLKNLGDYPDLHVQSDTLLLADVFGNFNNKCLKIYELDPAHFLSAPGLAWQACLKYKRAKLEILTDMDMLLMVEKGIKGEACHVMHRFAKANDEHFIKNYDEDSNKGYFLKANMEYPKKLPNLHSDLPFLSERNKIIKCYKLFCDVRDKKNYVVHKRALKQALNHGLI